MTTLTINLPTELSMLELGSRIANVTGDTSVFFLYGELGAGKTTFVRGFLRGLGYEGYVKSPTYTLVESYNTEKHVVYHFDFYRVCDSRELEYIGIQDYFAPNTICLIEWPDYGSGMLPESDVSCYIESAGSGRKMKVTANSPRGHNILQRWNE